MFSSTVVRRAGTALVVAGTCFACGGGQPLRPASPVSPVVTTIQDRKTVRTADQEIVVDSPVVAGRRVERLVTDAGGYIERSVSSTNGDVRIVGRVPAAQLDGLMDSAATLGEEKRRRTTGADVTDQHVDLAARLRSTQALRGRLQQLLERAATLDEVLHLETQIARLQTEIDALQSRLDHLDSQIAMAALTVELDRKRVYGPVAQAGRGMVWLVSKLFVIR